MPAIYHDLFIEASEEAIYNAVSLPEHLVNWWPRLCSGKPELGATYNFEFTPKYNWFGEVSYCQKPKAFYIKMTKADQDWDPTTFGFDIKNEKAGIQRVSFWHKDWPAINDHFKVATFCWAMLLNGLKGYVEKGKVVPFEERN